MLAVHGALTRRQSFLPFFYLLLLACCTPLPAQTDSAQAAKIRGDQYRAAENAISAVNMPSTAPLFLENDTFSSTVHIVNEGNPAVTGSLVLRAVDGSLIARKAVPLGGHSSTAIRVADLLKSSTQTPVHVGRLELYDDTVEGSALAGQIILKYTDRARLHSIDEEMLMPSMTTSHALRAVAISATGDPYVAVSNPSAVVENVTANCYPEGTVAKQLQFTIQGQQTVFLQGCSLLAGTQGPILTESSSSVDQNGKTYGMEVVATTPHGEIEAFGLAPHTQSGAVEWTAVNFFDPDKFLSRLTIFAGIPVGSTPELWGTYTPHLALHNFSSVAQTVSATMAWTLDSAPHRSVVGSIVIQPGNSASMKLDNVIGSSDLLNTLTVSGSDSNGGIAAQLMVEDSSQDLRFQIIGKSGADDTNIGMHPWRLNGNDDNILLLYNETATVQKAYIRLGNGEKVWTTTYTLQPGVTMRLGLRSLLASKAVDENGLKLSAGVKYGSISWSADDKQRVKGRLLHIDSDSSSVESFQCAGYEVLCNGGVFGPSSLKLGQQGTWQGTYSGCINNQAPNQCYGVQNGSQAPASYGWSASGFSNFVGLNSSAMTATASTVGNGSVLVSMTSYAGCVVSGSQPVTITAACPSTVAVTAQTVEPLADVLSTWKTGIGEVATMTVGGTSGPYNGASITETVSQSSNSCGLNLCSGGGTFVVGQGGTPHGDPKLSFAPANNVFYDEHFYEYSSSKLSSGSCAATCRQTYQCGGTTIGTHTFTINYSLAPGNISGTPVTNVTVTKN